MGVYYQTWYLQGSMAVGHMFWDKKQYLGGEHMLEARFFFFLLFILLFNLFIAIFLCLMLS